MHIGILGAGIVGLNTALHIQQEFATAQVTLISEKFDKDTTSYGAAGIFRPGTNFTGPTPEITKIWVKNSYNFYDEILQSPEADKAGIFQISGYIFSSQYYSLTRNHFLEDLVPIYRKVNEDEFQLCNGDWKYGSYFTTMIIDQSNFLPWARSRFESGGGRVQCHKIESFRDLEKVPGHSNSVRPVFDVVFNCTGFGSKWLCNDNKVVPVRGQVLKVKAPWMKMFFYGDYDTYIVPGRNSVTLGGCRQLDNYNTSVCRHDSKAIWERCTSLQPSLEKATILNEWVGLRPHRDVLRCEIEEIEIGDNKKLKVIHNYGHGGYGITTSPGTSKYAVELFLETLRSSNNGSSLMFNTACYTPTFTSSTKLHWKQVKWNF